MARRARSAASPWRSPSPGAARPGASRSTPRSRATSSPWRWARVEAPRAWLDDAACLPADARELAALTVEASVELASTTLAAGDLAAVAPGDAVVFDGERALASSAPWPARLVLGDHAADAVV